MSIKIIISGVCGKMGLSILNLATKDPEIKIAGILEEKIILWSENKSVNSVKQEKLLMI